MNTDAYKNYLQTKKWEGKRQEAFAFHSRYCKICKCTDKLDVHHIRYDNLFSENVKTDLAILCRFHHESYHKMYNASVKNFKKFCNFWEVEYSRPIHSKLTKKKYHKKKKRKTRLQIRYDAYTSFHKKSKKDKIVMNLEYIKNIGGDTKKLEELLSKCV